MPAPNLSDNAQKVLEARYLRRDEEGRVAETPAELFQRVAGAVAAPEQRFADARVRGHWQERFFDALVRLDFLPNSPTLMNAGTPLRQLSACFVLPVEDDMAGIFDSLKQMALIQQSGGGTGFSFSKLRPEGDLVASTGGTSSGPVAFMRIFDAATENIRQGGKRRGANMGSCAPRSVASSTVKRSRKAISTARSTRYACCGSSRPSSLLSSCSQPAVVCSVL